MRWLLLLLLAACTVADAEGPRKLPGACFAYLDVHPDALTIDTLGTDLLEGDEWTSCAVLANDSTVTWTSRNTGIFTIASTGTVTATVTGVAVGSAYAVGEVGAHADSSLITVSAAPPPVAGVCPASGYLRLVNVSNVTQLVAAVGAALPGDQIQMAAGTYTLTSDLVLTRSGTSSDPITLCGPRTAILTYWPIQPKANYWWLRGFRHNGLGHALWNIYSDPASHMLYDSLELDHSYQESFHLHGSSKHNEIKYVYIHNTGNGRPSNGEGIYFGSGGTNTDRADSNWAHDNVLVDITQECFDVKEGTTHNVVSNNSMTRCGTFASVGGDAGIALRGDSSHTYGNRITTTPRYAEQVWPDCSSGCVTFGKGNIIQKDTMSGMGGGYPAVQVRGGYEAYTKVCTDNVVVGASIGAATSSCGAFTPGLP